MEMSNEIVAVGAAIIGAVAANSKSIINAIGKRIVRKIDRPRPHLNLETHPIFVGIPLYLTQNLPSIQFKYRVRKELIIEYLQIRWDLILFTLKDEINTFDFKNDTQENIIIKHSNNFIRMEMEIRKTLVERNFPPKVYDKFNSSQRFIDITFVSVFVSIFRSTKIYDNNTERFYAFLDMMYTLHEDAQKQAVLALADLNGEISEVDYKRDKYEYKFLQ